MNLIKYIRMALILAIVSLIAYSYHPLNFDSTGEVINSSSSKYAMVLIPLVFLFSFNKIKETLSIDMVRLYIIVLGMVALCLGIVFALGLTETFKEIRMLSIAFIALILGASFRLSDKAIVSICFIFSVITLYVGYLQISQNIGEFMIEDGYISTPKNAFGPMITMAGILFLLIALTPTCNKIIRGISLVASTFALIEVATIRARLATIIFIFLFIYIIYRYLKTINRRQAIGAYYLIVTIIFIALFIVLRDYIWDSLIRNREDDFSSGRIETYYDSIDIIARSPLWGQLTLKEEIAWVHNYLLRILSEYGVIISLPLLVLFFYLSSVIVRGTIKNNIFIPQNYGYMVISISLLASMGEPTFPYGPGTTNFLPFFLLGLTLRNEYISGIARKYLQG